MITYCSTKACYDYEDAINSAMDAASAEHDQFIVVSTIVDHYFCDDCNDVHFHCKVQIQVKEHVESDLAIKLKALLSR